MGARKQPSPPPGSPGYTGPEKNFKPTPPPPPPDKRGEQDSVRQLCSALIARIEAVYQPSYVNRIAQEEPESMLGLMVRLKRALKA